jgi:hypothetical protein
MVANGTRYRDDKAWAGVELNILPLGVRADSGGEGIDGNGVAMRGAGWHESKLDRRNGRAGDVVQHIEGEGRAHQVNKTLAGLGGADRIRHPYGEVVAGSPGHGFHRNKNRLEGSLDGVRRWEEAGKGDLRTEHNGV